jgi:hypothetical protein
MMDVAGLAGQAAAALGPALPLLLGKAVDEAGKEFGKEAWDQVRALWEGLRPRIEARPAAKEAADDVANHPDDEDARAALRLQLKKLLSEDPALGQQVARLLEQRSGPSIEVHASGERSVAAYNVSNSTISTGDRH